MRAMHDRVSAVMQQVTCLRVATAGLALAVAAGWSSLLLVVMGRVVPGWAVGTGLCLVSLILMAVHVVRRVSADDTYPQGRRVLPRVALALDGGSRTRQCGRSGQRPLGGADYRVLEPVGPYGCTAVVRETSFLKISDGVVYAVGPTGVAWRESGSWMADDMHRPVADGTYELSWNGSGVGTFRVRGTATDPIVASDVGPLDCG